MATELELWQFIADRIWSNQPVMLLIVAESSGSSPGRAGYKRAVGSDHELCGSIGGGVMEVNLVEQSRSALLNPGERNSAISEQVHQKNSPHSSGMICSGKQTVIFCLLTSDKAETVAAVIDVLERRTTAYLTITPSRFSVEPSEGEGQHEDFKFERHTDSEFIYADRLGVKNTLYIIGGGHCALALSELMSKMDFRISIFDDRPELNTLAKNQFTDKITIIESYESIAAFIPSGANAYVVVMTLGFKSDEIVIRSLFDKDFKYFGVLGSRAKMRTLLNTLEKDGFSKERLSQIHTPIGLPINSRTPEEIAVSIAAEIILIKNS